MSHFREVCLDHGALIRECRCSAPYKMEVRKTCPGPGICPAYTVTRSLPTATGPTGPAAGHYVEYAGTTHYVESAEIREEVFDEQPMPKIGGEGSCAQDLAIEGIEGRKTIGLERYGTLLYPLNGRDMFRDLLEECQDAIVYASAYQAEREMMIESIKDAFQRANEAEYAEGALAIIEDALETVQKWLEGKDIG